MRKPSLLILIAGLLVLSCEQQKIPFEMLKKNMLSRMVGTWQVENEPLFEEWSVAADSSYLATSYALRNDEKVIIEMIRLYPWEDDIIYEATVMDQNEGKPIRFRLIEITENKMIFVNPEHDFPRRIEYEVIDNDHLKAIVSDGEGEGGKSFTIKFIRVMKEKKVTGIGGICFKAEHPQKNKIELWEPVDNEFTQSYEGETTK